MSLSLVKIFFVSVYGYKKISNKGCDEYKYEEFYQLEDAKQACLNDTLCSGIFDEECGAAKKYYLCPEKDNVLIPSDLSCVYDKIIIGITLIDII